MDGGPLSSPEEVEPISTKDIAFAFAAPLCLTISRQEFKKAFHGHRHPLLVILILLLIGALPTCRTARDGLLPSGGLGSSSSPLPSC